MASLQRTAIAVPHYGMETLPELLALLRVVHRPLLDSSHKGSVLWNIDVSLLLAQTRSCTDGWVVGYLSRYGAHRTSLYSYIITPLRTNTGVWWTEPVGLNINKISVNIQYA